MAPLFRLLNAAVFLTAGNAFGAITFNEILNNAPGGGDNGQEYVEFLANPGESFAGVSVLQIDGDGPDAGKIDHIYTFGVSNVAGTNGLFLFRDVANSLQPDPDPATTVFVEPDPQGFFSSDLENGSSTFVLVTGYTGFPADIDFSNDGTIDVALPWSTTLDVVGWLDGSNPDDRVYASQLGGVEWLSGTGIIGAPDAYIRGQGGAGFFLDITDDNVDGNRNGPYRPIIGRVNRVDGSSVDASGILMTPGSANIPEPSAGLLGLLALLVSFRRRR